MNTNEFIECLVDDGLDNNTIIDFVRSNDEICRAMVSFIKDAVAKSWSGSAWTPAEILDSAVSSGILVKKGDCVYSYPDRLKNLFPDL